MTRYNIRVKLSLDGIEKLRKKISLIKDGMPTVQKLFIEYSIDYLDERARYHLGESIGHSWYVPTGALMSSFQKEYGTDMGRLFNDYFTAA